MLTSSLRELDRSTLWLAGADGLVEALRSARPVPGCSPCDARTALRTHLQQIESCGHFFLARDSVFWFICELLEYDRASILRWVRQLELERGTESRVCAAEATLRFRH